MNKDCIKIANCSGFYGDKLSAAKDLVDGGPIDVLTGDYLAELTMAILFGQKMHFETNQSNRKVMQRKKYQDCK